MRVRVRVRVRARARACVRVLHIRQASHSVSNSASQIPNIFIMCAVIAKHCRLLRMVAGIAININKKNKKLISSAVSKNVLLSPAVSEGWNCHSSCVVRFQSR